ncbi:hypothetical protein ABIC09_005274 [Bradyrhizobium sp. S3.12.5]|uniref:Uncharacterized protein n=1 Tax=Bradyrhizobium cytisi TaxID=515489 RepID=A0A5S4X3B9_9BRAD|nr:hypothetical protein [Bradyrhizobium cytisi]TYL88204.1 hypothetical protein FXB38_01635 [Bradyrhizobium cytisi]
MTRNANLDDEAARLTELLRGKVVNVVWRHRPKEIGIEFNDGTRLFVDAVDDGLDLSVTGGDEFDET